MSNENHTADEDDLRSIAAELERRRTRIAKVQQSMAVMVGAYDLVAADLRAAYGEIDSAGRAPSTDGARP